MQILALDLGAATGVAIGRADDNPLCHSERLGKAGDKHGARFMQLHFVLKRLIEQHAPDLIVIEQPIASGVKGAQQRVQLAMGYRAVVAVVCFQRNLPFHEFPVQSIRKHFIGSGTTKRVAAKTATIERCRQLGWHVANDNEADAAAVFEYARAVLAKKFTMPKGLFDGSSKNP